MDQLIQAITVYALPVLFAITLHEAAHGYAARHFGDNTAYMMGRLSLNPARHIDPVGTILVPLVLYFATGGSFLFGYAKPVPVNFGALRNPKRDMVWVALAGPASNFAQAFLYGLAVLVMNRLGVREVFFFDVARAGILVNLVMFVFNLFPIPPLDGGRVLVGLLPLRQALALSRIEPYGFFIVMALVLTNIATTVWLIPLMRVSQTLLGLLLSPFGMIL
ncbi:MAG: site-2 protease family protein [Betaproteobacteria bacterium]|nr:site-2 protease family protein [Betaproteobacteria bacterium]MBU6511223.1 site-2 protease family protein [Betaproteobacteria bacterium]MDE1955916.1 site-2 protease family protein [Betaproteobacteria bacterium]MDE2151553.1 site-2 protease family protein [Betaproteobacteria bacterium]MDE2478649.1 site-2 protease family protein [Betaproteobacteria bacterium]